MTVYWAKCRSLSGREFTRQFDSMTSRELFKAEATGKYQATVLQEWVSDEAPLRVAVHPDGERWH